MAADVNAIAIGYEGKLDMFETAGWIKREKPVEVEKLPVMTPGFFKATFDRARK